MFSICLKNSSPDYKVFLDGEELPLHYSSSKSEYVTSNDNQGQHAITIKKDSGNTKLSQIILFWISTLLTSYDESMISLYRSAKKIDITFNVEVNENFKFVFDTYTNKVINCSGEYNVILDNSADDINVKTKLNFYIKLPLMILTGITLVPLWFLSVLMLIKSFDSLAVSIFAFTSVLIVLSLISWLRDKKNNW